MALWRCPYITEEALQLACIGLFSPELLEMEEMNPAQNTNTAC